jgi:hypothetical protein
VQFMLQNLLLQYSVIGFDRQMLTAAVISLIICCMCVLFSLHGQLGACAQTVVFGNAGEQAHCGTHSGRTCRGGSHAFGDITCRSSPCRRLLRWHGARKANCIGLAQDCGSIRTSLV